MAQAGAGGSGDIFRKYFRYLGPRLAIASNKNQTRQWYQELRGARFFDLQVEDVSATLVEMLSMEVLVQGSQLRTIPNKLARGLPLGIGSAHNSSVHHTCRRPAYPTSEACARTILT